MQIFFLGPKELKFHMSAWNFCKRFQVPPKASHGIPKKYASDAPPMATRWIANVWIFDGDVSKPWHDIFWFKLSSQRVMNSFGNAKWVVGCHHWADSRAIPAATAAVKQSNIINLVDVSSGQIASQLLLMSLSQQLRSICWSASINWWPWLMPQQSWACPRTEQRSIHCAQQQEKLYRKKKHGKEVKSKFMSNHGDPFEAMSTWVSFIIHGKPLPQYHNKPLELYEILQSQQKEPGEVSSSGIRALSSTYQTITLCWRMGLWHCWFWRRHWELFIVHVVHVHWQGIHHVWSRWSRN